jgi:hypothetical protein
MAASVLSVLLDASAVEPVLVAAAMLLAPVLLVLDEADPGPPCGAAAWNSAPRNCCSAAVIALSEVDEVAEVEPVDEEAEDEDVEEVDDVLPDDVTPNCASAAAIAATSGFVGDVPLVEVDDESFALCD